MSVGMACYLFLNVLSIQYVSMSDLIRWLYDLIPLNFAAV
jgi:hypothetical protein